MTNSKSLENKIAVITGASSGIGRALALELARHHSRLVLAARDKPSLEEVADQCITLGTEAMVCPTDVSVESECHELIEQTVQYYNGIDVLVNNAGISMWAKFDEMDTLRPFEEIMRVNYLGAVYCTYHALPYIKASAGQLVAISSLAGKNGVPTRSGYAASKHAMVGFFDSLRIELAASGVDVTIIYPGFVATEIRKRAVGEHGAAKVTSPIDEGKAMSPEIAAQKMMRAIRNRDRELIMTLRGKVGNYIKLIAPGFVDRIARRTIERGY